MFTQQTTAPRRPRLAAGALVAVALTAAVLVVAIQASSIRSTSIGPRVPEVPAQSAPTANAEVPTSVHISKGCWRRKFGCGQGATATANPEHRTSRHISKGCWRRKFGCGQGATTTAKRP
jgi:hypothetical protein